MRLRRIEFIAIALTFAFVCFVGGYFTGSRGAVNITAVEPQYGETQQFSAEDKPNMSINTGSDPALPGTSAEGIDFAKPGENSPAPAVHPSSGDAVGMPRSGDGKININIASRSELMDLPGIGEILAGRIVDYRSQNGSFSNIEDIKRVSGIGTKRFEAIKDKITVG